MRMGGIEARRARLLPELRRASAALALGALAAWCLPGTARSAHADTPVRPAPTEAPAGTYSLDRNHASLLFRVNHLGFSYYTARFTRFAAELAFDPADPAASSITASIDATSIETDHPDPSFDFDAQLQDEHWLNTARFPQMTFRSTAVELTGPDTARIAGELSLHGVTRPVTMTATFNGGYAGHPLDPSGARIGFSARGSLMRSAFGIAEGIPPPGSDFGVGDAVEILIEAEFTRPAPPRQ
jgi:polyisoprenoid-binding protein YceI